MGRRCMLIAIVWAAFVPMLASCGPGSVGSPQRVSRFVLFQVDRETQDGASARFEWSLSRQRFLQALPVDGVTLACDASGRSYSESGGSLLVRDFGYVYIHNGTGKTMYSTTATIEAIEPDTDGQVHVAFGRTVYNYGDIPNGGGSRGPDSYAVDGDEQEWYYDCDPSTTTDTYVNNLKFTVKVSWFEDP